MLSNQPFHEYLSQNQHELDSQLNEKTDIDYQEGIDNFDDQSPQSTGSMVHLKSYDSETKQSKDYVIDSYQKHQDSGYYDFESRTSLSQKTNNNYPSARKAVKNYDRNSGATSKSDFHELTQQINHINYLDKTPDSDIKSKLINQNYVKFGINTSHFTNTNLNLINKNLYDEFSKQNDKDVGILRETEQHLNSKYIPPMETNYFYSPITYIGSQKGDTKNISPNPQGNIYDISYNIRPVDSQDKKISIFKPYQVLSMYSNN